jgi:DNA-binding MarR family transcriptional regulator
MTNRIDRLEQAGLVTRMPDPADGRSSLVVLTSKGRGLVDRMIERHAKNELKLLSSLTTRERTALARLLRTLLLSFDDRPPSKGSRGPRGGATARSGRRS